MVEKINVKITKVVNNQNFEGYITGNQDPLSSKDHEPVIITILKIPNNVHVKINSVCEINIQSQQPPLIGFFKGIVKKDPYYIGWIKQWFN
jgi:hypothetical protein